MKLKCKNPECKYEWETQSKMLWVTCPSCRLKIKKPNATKPKEEK